MPLSWNEIRSRALDFSREWADETSESAEAKSFWDAFFNVFGIRRRRVASFEKPVRMADDRGGYIDLLWKGVLLVEHKSRGKNLDRAAHQAFDYFPGLKERDLPRYVLVSDYARFRLYDLEGAEPFREFALKDLHKHIRLFGFVAGYQTRTFGQEDPVNIQAAERLGRLHDLLKESGYAGHDLEVLLVRVLFCLFADDTAIFERSQFQEYLDQRTADDGSDLGMHLSTLFQVLNTPPDRRQSSLDEQLAAFPYVNGRLFAEPLPTASFDREMRETLLNCCGLNWSRISPAIFGSLFQSIMDKAARRNLGAHYTSETNILKALRPLFIDALRAEFERVRPNAKALYEFHKKLGAVRVLDPACGCGNFLVVAYRELRLLELDVLRELLKAKSGFIDVAPLVFVDVDQFHGIEFEDFPAQIAQVALWLTDHQMNLRVSEEFGQYFARLPLTKAPNIVHGNALTLDWREVVAPGMLSYIVGNPPFGGKKEQNARQKAEVRATFHGVKGAGVLDYVACWYRKAVEYMADNLAIRAAFVSTNSITQGEQVGVLWPDLLRRGARINFAHRTFQWTSEARGKAAVHCVVVGFALQDEPSKWLFDYDTPKSEPHVLNVPRVNAYLVPAADAFVGRRSRPVCTQAPEMAYGSMPIDDGWLTLSADERTALISEEPAAAPFVRPYLGGGEFLNGVERYCLWLVDCAPSTLRGLPEVMQRVEGNRTYRLSSGRAATVALARTPALFGEIRQPDGAYLFVPKVSSEGRDYIPVGFCGPEIIASGSALVVPAATPYAFGVIQSVMHMAWMRAVGGRTKSDYQYSNTIVYNNFPWPEPNDRHRAAIALAAQAVLDARALFPDATLADLYDPVTMPPALVKAHQALDRAVDRAYRGKAFATETERVAFLFERYVALTTS